MSRPIGGVILFSAAPARISGSLDEENKGPLNNETKRKQIIIFMSAVKNLGLLMDWKFFSIPYVHILSQVRPLIHGPLFKDLCLVLLFRNCSMWNNSEDFKSFIFFSYYITGRPFVLAHHFTILQKPCEIHFNQNNISIFLVTLPSVNY